MEIRDGTKRKEGTTAFGNTGHDNAVVSKKQQALISICCNHLLPIVATQQWSFYFEEIKGFATIAFFPIYYFVIKAIQREKWLRNKSSTRNRGKICCYAFYFFEIKAEGNKILKQ